MGLVQIFAKEKKIWVKFNEWNDVTVITLWSSIWSDLLPYLSKVTVNKDAPGSETSLHKSRASQVSWQTCYNKICKQGVAKINKVCHSTKRESLEEGIDTNIGQQEKAKRDREKVKKDWENAKKDHQADEARERLCCKEAAAKKEEALQRCKDLMTDLTPEEEQIARDAIYGEGQAD